jgi:hypothetical protein
VPERVWRIDFQGTGYVRAAINSKNEQAGTRLGHEVNRVYYECSYQISSVAEGLNDSPEISAPVRRYRTDYIFQHD